MVRNNSTKNPSNRWSWRRSWRLGDDIIDREPFNWDILFDYWSQTTLGNYSSDTLRSLPEEPVFNSSEETLRSEAPFDSPEDHEKRKQKAEDWHLSETVRSIQKQRGKDEVKDRKLGVTWQHLTIKGRGSDSAIAENVGSQFNVARAIKDTFSSKPDDLKTIIDDSHGCVRPGEMLLVLGRPGAGCSTLLRALANRSSGYAEFNGELRYGNMSAKEAQKYHGQIVINTEDDVSFPTLKVGQTIDFATRLKNPRTIPSSYSSRKHYHEATRDFLLQSMHIEHTRDIKVGDAFTRGVSGGERRRASIIETLATRASVYCWDNPTRGLDASTALEYAKALRVLSDELGHAHVVTLYQAGNAIFDLFDKVLVLDHGKQIYYGPAKQAKAFMEDLGFQYTPGANVADFLTSVTVPTERKVRDGVLDFPRNGTGIKSRYDLTAIKSAMVKEYNYPNSDEAHQLTASFKDEVMRDKHRSLPKRSSLTVGFRRQVQAAVIRQFQLLRGDCTSFFVTQASTVVQGLVISSIFYNAPSDSSGLFLKGGALFFCMLYQSLVAMSEVTASFGARPVLAKHRGYAFYHPAAFCIAQIIVDIPSHILGVTLFVLPLWGLVGLRESAAAFFTLWAVTFATAMCMTAMFRSIGASMPTFDAASKLSGFAISALTMYMGYVITKPQMHPWFVWIFWINPLAYGFESLMGNEFRADVIPCVSNNLVPSGPGYEDSAFQACTGVKGAPTGATSVTGEQYLHSLSYSSNHVWRNFGILWAWWALFVFLSIFFTCRWNQQTGNSGVLLTPRGLSNTKRKAVADDVESQLDSQRSSEITLEKRNSGSSTVRNEDLVRNTSVFTWRDLTYTIKTAAGERTLLDHVHGWVKPGMLGALMGSSGAGKTTLLDVLAQRKTEGTIRGQVLVDGRALPLSFQRSAGYCEQLDVHEPLTTVREALIFSAMLRQPQSVSQDEKLRYVDTIIDLLEMRDIEHAIVGTPSAGLSVEQRKRLTIGVELVAKPSTLIFLDEPTSGLDGQAAYNIVRFLRKLADAGQAVLVTIHQPSALLFQQFDHLVLLSRGGKTVYNGDIGENAQVLKDYFARNGCPCPEDANPAEHMIDVVSGSLSKGRDWNKIWLQSVEYASMLSTLDHLVSDASSREVQKSNDDGQEFATSLWEQTKIVTQRMGTTLWRNTDYINNKFNLHITSALFNGFTFWMIGDGFGEVNTVSQLQLRLFTIFQFIFVAPGVIAQLQPLFLERRDIYETREKKAKMYHWAAFTTALIVTEIPYLMICSVLYFFCWYYTVGFPLAASAAGSSYFVVLMYEFIYTGVGQFVAAYAPNAISASMINPLVINVLSAFCGVLVPWIQMPAFWRYWLYYLNPFTYLLGSLLVFTSYDVTVHCGENEFAVFDPPSNQTCGDYLSNYLESADGFGRNLTNPAATSGCQVCEYTTGADYLATLNLNSYSDGWRDAGICALFAISSYACVYLLMKLRTKATKTAE